MDDTDRAALRAASGDDVAFGFLVRTFQGKIRAFLLRMTKGNHALADDLAQETFLEAFRKIAHYRGEGPFKAWLYRVAYTRFLMEARKKKRESDEMPEDVPAPETIGATHARLDLESAMTRLSAQERATLTLCYALEFSNTEAAEILDMPVGTVKSHVLRGREKLKSMLEVAA
ncbi:MAG TPA: sigma-70 family RNA polymerase sigma factor [Rhizomicrobium sp.]|jgi:RNA polymerase sigma-70 factor (ECF subfamily)|nr:sigma-70 family RNA polymerase sigma factor [Rhizomicrobium sp.]